MIAFIAAVALASAGPEIEPIVPNPPRMDLQPFLLALSVPNAEVTAAWYRENLGFQEFKRNEYPAHGLKIIFLEANGFRLELVEKAGSYPIAKYEPKYEPMSGLLQGVSKVAFRVNDIERWATHLVGRGVKFVVPLTTSASMQQRHFVIQDLNGNLVQLVEPAN